MARFFILAIMPTVSIHQAKDRFSSLLQAVEAGEEVIITRHGKKIARIVHEAEIDTTQVQRDRAMQEAVADLQRFQSQVGQAREGLSDWKSLRDAGRKE